MNEKIKIMVEAVATGKVKASHIDGGDGTLTKWSQGQGSKPGKIERFWNKYLSITQTKDLDNLSITTEKDLEPSITRAKDLEIEALKQQIKSITQAHDLEIESIT